MYLSVCLSVCLSTFHSQFIHYLKSFFSIYTQFDVNWRIRGFVTLGLVEHALDILNLVCDDKEKNLSVSEGVVAMLEEVVMEEKEVEKVKVRGVVTQFNTTYINNIIIYTSIRILRGTLKKIYS